MLNSFIESSDKAVSIEPLVLKDFPAWLAQQSSAIQNWVKINNFTARPDSFCLLPDSSGHLQSVLLGVRDEQDFWPFGALSAALPEGHYKITNVNDKKTLSQAMLAWGLGAYQFSRYRRSDKVFPQLVIPASIDIKKSMTMINAIYDIRDLINTPADHMGPADLTEVAAQLARVYSAEIRVLVGEELLANNFPAIYTVGRASEHAPRLIDIRWGNEQAPKVTLVGKGVCFDTGGLDLKTASGMLLMKKDMGGAAHVLGLAKMIMEMQLPIRLRVLVPAVENSVSSNAYHPGDVIKTRKGITVEVGNTDAEGRLILCDALAEAASENPQLIIDIATLTGAAKVAVGTEISSMFTASDTIANAILKHSVAEQDPIWRMPLYMPYRQLLDSKIADINNASASSFAGSITAALFLQEFVPATIPWVHFDLMAWNVNNRPGRPEGAEAQAVRAIFEYLFERFQ